MNNKNMGLSLIYWNGAVVFFGIITILTLLKGTFLSETVDVKTYWILMTIFAGLLLSWCNGRADKIRNEFIINKKLDK